MGISLYQGISRHLITASRTTSEGKTYTLDHPGELVVNMRFKGGEGASINSQGWERSSSYYFRELHIQHPEYFSKKNKILIESGRSPIVDAKFTNHFPQYKNYQGETLVHHHVGQDGQAVALPQSIHKGFGEIHSIEHDLGITDEAQKFSASCDAECKRDPTLYGQTSDQFRAVLRGRSQSGEKNISEEVEGKSSSVYNAIKGATHNSKGTESKPSAPNTHGHSANRIH